ncbi:Protein kinase-like (PK-like) [Venustampulla echinocandica]|uniref:Protein kinase-like (PK-like) n=1 Tax=Venustampulla echinocandica TaxID=2656787 RepID=A0A370TDT1_9HELO|nr:Protein kinase-like (PK-like) [Venustampulla echinocandica]RDL32602.1 Protein kinase-like (PK-like) [Venustampulla echinocandica]
MAEVFGIVTGVLGLLPLCRDGLGMIKDVFGAPGTLQLAVGRLELQRDRYDEWRDIWRDEDGEKDLRFEAYAKSNPAAARRVLRQLALLSQVLFDARSLEEQYGIRPDGRSNRDAKDLSQFRLKSGQDLTIETQGSFLERCKTNMSFMKRCRFVFRKKEASWNNLIDLLKEYNENLTMYGPKFELEKMLKSEFEMLRQLQLDELRRLAEASAYEHKHSLPNNNHAVRYHSLSLAAQFSAVVKYERPHAAFKFSMRDFRLDPAYILSSSGSSTMALLFDYPVKKEHRVVLIEWIDGIDRDQERDTRIKTLMLATPKPGQLLLPTCYGMVEDTFAGRFGLVLAPPTHIRSNLPPILSAGAISQKRMPVSLKELLDKVHPSNIRSNSILFFPAKNKPSTGPPGPASGYPQPIGYDEPLFVGLGSSRVDDVIDDPGDYYDDLHEPRRHDWVVTKRPGDINLDYYQHPEKRRNPSMRYSRAHDIYSLGCVLLEIGLWKPLDRIVEIEDGDFERTKKTFQGLTMELDGLTGSIYGNIVRSCLAISTRERTESEARQLSKFCAEIAATLDKCNA